MRKATEVEAIITYRQKMLGMSMNELALSCVGSVSTLYERFHNPLEFRQIEIQRLFNNLHFSEELQSDFYRAMRTLGKDKR